MTRLLTREAILAAPIPTRDVEVPEWGGPVRLRAITVKNRMLLLDAIAERQEAVDAYEADQALSEDEREGVAKVAPLDQTILSVLFAVVDDKLQPLFSIDDYARFEEELSLPTLNYLFRALLEIETRQGLSFEEQKKSSAGRKTGASSSA